MNNNFMYIFLLVSTEIAFCLGISKGLIQGNENSQLPGANLEVTGTHPGLVKRSLAFKRLPGWSVYYGKRSAEYPNDSSEDEAERILRDISSEIIHEPTNDREEILKDIFDYEKWIQHQENDPSIPVSDSENELSKRANIKGLQSWVSGYGKRDDELTKVYDPNFTVNELNDKDDFYSNPDSEGTNTDTVDGVTDKAMDEEKRSGWGAMYGKRSPAWFTAGYGKRPAWFTSYGKRSPAWFTGYGKRSPAWFSGYGKRSPAWFSGYGKRSPAWFTGYGKRSPAWFTGYGKRSPAWFSGYGKRSPAWFSGYGKRSPAWFSGYGKRSPAWFTGYGKRSPAWFSGYGKRSPAWFTGYGKRSPAWFTGYGKRSPAWFTGYGKRSPTRMTGYGRRSPAWFSSYGKRSGWLSGYGKREDSNDETNDNEIDALTNNESESIIKEIKDIENRQQQADDWSSEDKSTHSQAWSDIYER